MTERKEKIQTEDLFHRLLDGVCVVDREGRILFANDAAKKFAGEKELVGKTETDFFGSPAVVEMCVERHDVVSFPKEAADGRIFTVSAFPMENEEHEEDAIFFFIREKEDISDGDDLNSLMVYKGSSMAHVLSLAAKLAHMDNTVLISGESGTGKSMLARYIHDNSSRGDSSFASLNCAAMAGDLLEEELFGRAGKNGEIEKPGIFATAGRGTLLLDEIDALPTFIQTRLLYALQERKYHPVGGRKFLPVECRMIASTDRDLHMMVRNGDFREDLYYLIDVFEVDIPPIRERVADIMPLIRYLAERFNRRYGLSRRITDGALDILTKYSWPGNLREMENTIERLVVMAPEDIIDIYHLPDPIRFQLVAEEQTEKETGSLTAAVEEVERVIIRRTYEKYGSSYEVGRVLKISQSKASRLIRKYCGSKNKA